MTTLTTEAQNPSSLDIDTLSSSDIVRLINAEDAVVATAVRSALPQIADAVDAIAAAIAGGGRLFYVGAGTSGRLGILDAVECVPTFGTPPHLVQGIIAGGATAVTQAVEGAEDDWEQARHDLAERGLTSADIVCGIAASGRTPYVVAALQFAGEHGARTIAIACNHASAIAEQAEISISVELGAEVIAGSTRMKAGTAQKMILNMLSTGTMIRLGKVYGNLMIDVRVTNRKLAERAVRLVQQLTGVDDATARQLLAQSNNNVKAAVVMQRLGLDCETALRRLNDTAGQLRSVIDRDDA